MKAAPSRGKRPPARHPYSKAWREAYGRGLTRDEIRLVQGYRGLSKRTQGLVLTLVARLVLKRAAGGAR